jgi:hypothetical protein
MKMIMHCSVWVITTALCILCFPCQCWAQTTTAQLQVDNARSAVIESTLHQASMPGALDRLSTSAYPLGDRLYLHRDMRQGDSGFAPNTGHFSPPEKPEDSLLRMLRYQLETRIVYIEALEHENATIRARVPELQAEIARLKPQGTSSNAVSSQQNSAATGPTAVRPSQAFSPDGMTSTNLRPELNIPQFDDTHAEGSISALKHQMATRDVYIKFLEAENSPLRARIWQLETELDGLKTSTSLTTNESGNNTSGHSSNISTNANNR